MIAVEPVAVKSKTQIVSVLFVDIVGYSKRSVTQQVEIKRAFNAHLGDALSPVLPDDWILLDTGDGAAIAFLNSPEEALLTSGRLMTLAYPENSEPIYNLRSGLHLGPVVIVHDVNGAANLVGDAINDAQRIMSFAGEDEVFSSRQYAELVERIDTSYVDRFSSMGYMQDKHGRAHDLARVAPSGYKIPVKTAAVKEIPDTTVALSARSGVAHVESPSSTTDRPLIAKRMPTTALMLGGLAAFAFVVWMFLHSTKPAETPVVPVVESSKSAFGSGVSTPVDVEKQPQTSSHPKLVSPATSVAKPVQEPRRPVVPDKELRFQGDTSRSQTSSMESLDCPQCSCTDLLERVSRGATLTAAETSFLRTRCQWQQSPQSGGVGKPSSLTKQVPASAPGQQAAERPAPAPQAQVHAKPQDKIAADVRQPVAPSGQANVQGIPDCPYCSCPDLLTKVSLGVPLSSTETKYLRTKCQ